MEIRKTRITAWLYDSAHKNRTDRLMGVQASKCIYGWTTRERNVFSHAITGAEA